MSTKEAQHVHYGNRGVESVRSIIPLNLPQPSYVSADSMETQTQRDEDPTAGGWWWVTQLMSLTCTPYCLPYCLPAS